MFSSGFIWFYWKYHKDGNKRYQPPTNENDYGGYEEKELYVPQKYQSYKQEILEQISKESYDLALEKATQYMQISTIRAIEANMYGYAWMNYGISEYERISLNHVIALILYCDFSAYCTKFSSTFRKIFSTESMAEVKARNSSFWFQSKFFREAVECFGTNNNTDSLPDGGKPDTGPFYTGLDVVLAIPAFSIRLASPTSTSKHVAVSLNFSKQTGMIIELDNPESDSRASNASLFDVSWLSRFPDEDERVFAGIVTLCSIYNHIAYIFNKYRWCMASQSSICTNHRDKL